MVNRQDGVDSPQPRTKTALLDGTELSGTCLRRKTAPSANRRHAWLLIAVLCTPSYSQQLLPPAAIPQAHAPQKILTFGGKEVFTYAVEWRLVRAGTAKLSWTASGSGWQGDIHLESSGLVSKLYRVDDNYIVQAEDQLCASTIYMKALEGKRSRETRVGFDRAH